MEIHYIVSQELNICCQLLSTLFLGYGRVLHTAARPSADFHPINFELNTLNFSWLLVSFY